MHARFGLPHRLLDLVHNHFSTLAGAIFVLDIATRFDFSPSACSRTELEGIEVGKDNTDCGSMPWASPQIAQPCRTRP